MPELVVREIEMPTKIFGAELKNLAHISDVVRLEAVYTQGGKLSLTLPSDNL